MKGNFFTRKIIGIFALTCLATAAYAVEDGVVTNNLMSMFGGIGSTFEGICLVVGIGLVFASFIQYRQHRMNKLLVPISKPIFLFILGVFLACIPVLGHYTQGGQLITQEISA
jgi:hypothetical protein